MTTTSGIPTTTPTAVPTAGLSITSFVLGMVSIAFGFTLIVPGIGAVLGFLGLRREPTGRGFAIAGLWINLVIIGFWVLLTGVVMLAVVGGLLTVPFWTQ